MKDDFFYGRYVPLVLSSLVSSTNRFDPIFAIRLSVFLVFKKINYFSSDFNLHNIQNERTGSPIYQNNHNDWEDKDSLSMKEKKFPVKKKWPLKNKI